MEYFYSITCNKQFLINGNAFIRILYYTKEECRRNSCLVYREIVFSRGGGVMKICMLKFIEFMRKIRIFKRLFLLYLFATFFPVFIFSIWSYNRNSEEVREKIYTSVNEIMNKISGEIEQKIEKVRNDSIEISYLEEIQEALSNYEMYNSRQLNQVKLDVTGMMSKKYVFDNIVSGIVMYTLTGSRHVLYGEDVYSVLLEPDYQEEFLRICYESDGKCVYRAVNQSNRILNPGIDKGDSVIVGKAVKNNETGKVVGYIILQLKRGCFSENFEEVALNMGAVAFVIDQENTLIAVSGEELEIGLKYTEDKFLENLVLDNMDHTDVTLDGENIEILQMPITGSDWKLVFLIPSSYFKEEISTILWLFLEIASVCLLAGLLVTFLFSVSIVIPLNNVIINGIEKFENGNLDIRLSEDGADELTRLSVQFNKMSREIQRLIAQEKETQRQKRKLEIQALQAQINPHFLANTLNTISYIAKIRKEETIEKLINAIIELLRDSMKNDDSLHLVREEISVITSYVTIQEYRLLGKFTVDIQVDQEVYDYMMPRFILQPVIENAIIHGIEPVSRRGRISVKGYKYDEQIIFQVIDNGAGMDKERIGEILHNEKNDQRQRFNGVGIGNVNKRIKLLMGNEYGLTIDSEKNVFTIVTVRLPLIRKEEMEHVQSIASR